MAPFSEELYGETLKLVNVKLDSSASSVGVYGAHKIDNGGTGSALDDDLWDDSDEVVETSDLDREWEKRREGFQTIGYRDGIIAGKEASAQEGFNLGFKESVKAGYRWGLVRGVTSALALLPDGVKDKLMETDSKRIQLQSLIESTSSVSSTDVLKSFHDDIISKTSLTAASPTSECLIDKYYGELTLFVKESPAIKIQPIIEPQNCKFLILNPAGRISGSLL